MKEYFVQNFSYFGDSKSLGCNLAELRWKNGLRVYFAKINEKTVLLLIGGIKNGQKKDIKRARLLLKKYGENKT